ncbi:hypothetical protein CMV_026238 [Castanea mollissima]|uniref:Uncharacterized protein n=1 Tax=Castanea mollissima TaxID=60419 RepID=A0A8J4QC55_9ROSI|nr:hypothetical protein CMV_026238 [Castanea mollissima]
MDSINDNNTNIMVDMRAERIVLPEHAPTIEGLMDISVTMDGGMVINGVTGDLMAINQIMEGVMVIMEGLMDIGVTMEDEMVINRVTGDPMAISPIMEGVVVIMGGILDLGSSSFQFSSSFPGSFCFYLQAKVVKTK